VNKVFIQTVCHLNRPVTRCEWVGGTICIFGLVGGTLEASVSLEVLEELHNVQLTIYTSFHRSEPKGNESEILICECSDGCEKTASIEWYEIESRFSFSG
jgi:hypothetical protein